MKRIIIISILFAALFTIKGQFTYFNTIYTMTPGVLVGVYWKMNQDMLSAG